MTGTEKQALWANDIQVKAFGKIDESIEKMSKSTLDWSETIAEFEKAKETLKLETRAVKWIDNRNMDAFQLIEWAKTVEKVSDSIVVLGKAEEKKENKVQTTIEVKTETVKKENSPELAQLQAELAEAVALENKAFGNSKSRAGIAVWSQALATVNKIKKQIQEVQYGI